MIKIVGQDNSVVSRVTCRNCGAVNEYTPSKVKLLWEGKDYSGGSDGAKGFHCASCGERVITESW